VAQVWRTVDDVPTAFAALLAERRPASIALSGGDTARHCYEAVAATPTDWSGTDVWFGDERWVAVSDPDSNEGMARAVWLDRVPVGAVHSMVRATGVGPGDPGASVEDAASAYDAALRAGPPIELVHLGLGPDGHTASLFPGAASLEVRDRWVVAAGDDAHPHPRLTLTFPAIAAARTVVVTVAGAGKRHALAAVRAGDRNLPAARVDASEVLWLCDADALG
jgi:6-phosphogluconolactonase